MLKVMLLSLGLSAPLVAAPEFKLPPEQAKQYANLYCKDIEKKNEQIALLNKLTLDNNLKLKKGSYALYEGRHHTYDKSGKLTESGTFQERWVVKETNGVQATVEVQIDGRGVKAVTRELTKGLFNAVLTEENPVQCLYWANFAAEFLEVTGNVVGKPAKVWMRKQTMLGNVEPVFVYTNDVPFDLVAYTETTFLSDRKEVTEKLLKEFSF